MHEEFPEPGFNRLCDKAACRNQVHPEFEHLLEQTREQKHIHALLMKLGLKHIWKAVLQREDFHNVVKVFDGGRISYDFVVAPDVKAAIITRLRKRYGAQTYAFGNSEVGILMLKAAD